jgi:radical SAM enzyme (TIGR01210 family)
MKYMPDLSFIDKPADWILSQRPPKNRVNPRQPYAYLTEEERSSEGTIDKIATLFLTNKECPFRCLMCDLWKNTTDEGLPPGAIPDQIQWALQKLPPAVQIKLYNSGNFFDAEAIPPVDYASIANLVKSFKTVIVECHPRLVGTSCLEFKTLLQPDLQVAMGLEIAHPDVLGKLNKRMTLADFERAVVFLNKNDISSRAFILLNPPFLPEKKSVYWAKRSIDFAFDAGVECCVVIPTRSGNGALDQLQKEGLFVQPRIESIEEVLAYGIGKKCGRVFADLWDIGKFSVCSACTPERIKRLQSMNLFQKIMEPVQCNICHKQ